MQTLTMAEPLYWQIIEDIRARIASGEWPPGHRLPSTTELVALYAEVLSTPNLAIGTVRQAITYLRWSTPPELVAEERKGVYVAPERKKRGRHPKE